MGLPYIYTKNPQDAEFLQNVHWEIWSIHQEEIASYKIDLKYQVIIGHQYKRYLNSTVSNKMIQNCPITITYITNAYNIFGHSLADTKGGPLVHKPYRVMVNFLLCQMFLKLQKVVTLMADVMFVNIIPVLITMYCSIKFVTIEYVSTHTANQLSKY